MLVCHRAVIHLPVSAVVWYERQCGLDGGCFYLISRTTVPSLFPWMAVGYHGCFRFLLFLVPKPRLCYSDGCSSNRAVHQRWGCSTICHGLILHLRHHCCWSLMLDHPNVGGPVQCLVGYPRLAGTRIGTKRAYMPRSVIVIVITYYR